MAQKDSKWWVKLIFQIVKVVIPIIVDEIDKDPKMPLKKVN